MKRVPFVFVASDATKNIVNPGDCDIEAFAIKAAELAAGNVTAESPLIEPMLNALPPAFDVALEANELLSYHVPDVTADVDWESAPSSHKQHPPTIVGLKYGVLVIGISILSPETCQALDS